MPNFMVRVELHGYAQQDIYDALHSAMARAGFSRSIEGTNGEWFNLPPAEYYSVQGPLASVETVRDMLRTIVDQVWTPASIFVTEAPNVAWSVPKNINLAATPVFGGLPATLLGAGF